MQLPQIPANAWLKLQPRTRSLAPRTFAANKQASANAASRTLQVISLKFAFGYILMFHSMLPNHRLKAKASPAVCIGWGTEHLGNCGSSAWQC